MKFIRTTACILFTGIVSLRGIDARAKRMPHHHANARPISKARSDNANVLPASMTWFRATHVQLSDIEEGSEGFAQVSLYADGEWHAESCYDTIPADGPTELSFGAARLVVPAAAWQAQDSHTFTYFVSSPTRIWRVSIDIDRGTWWVWMLDQDRKPWRALDNLDIDMRLNGRRAHETVPLRAPHGRDETFGYYQAGVAPMSCFSIDSLSVQRKPRGHDWWASYVQAQGVYNLSDCRQGSSLANVGARLQVGWTSLVVPRGGFKAAAHGWFTYTHQSNTLTWWLSIHPRTGEFSVNIWSTAAGINTSKDKIDVSLQLADQMGSVQMPARSLTHASGYSVRGALQEACPVLR